MKVLRLCSCPGQQLLQDARVPPHSFPPYPGASARTGWPGFGAQQSWCWALSAASLRAAQPSSQNQGVHFGLTHAMYQLSPHIPARAMFPIPVLNGPFCARRP